MIMDVPTVQYHWRRGRSRNPEISTIVSEAEDIAGRGVKEIVLQE